MRFTVTSLNELSTCAERYRQRYIEHIRTAPTSSLILGRAVDESVSFDLKSKIDTGALLHAQEVIDIAKNAVDGILSTEGIALTEEQAAKGMTRVRAEITNDAVRMAQMHHTYVAPRLEPTKVQREFEIEVAGHRIAGRIDVQEGSRSVRDTKVTGKAPSIDEANRSLQLTIYAMACAQLDGRIPEHLYLDYLVNTAQPRVVKLESTRSRYQFAAVEERVKVAVRMVEAGIFLPTTPNAWYCSDSGCAYYAGCRYV